MGNELRLEIAEVMEYEFVRLGLHVDDGISAILDKLRAMLLPHYPEETVFHFTLDLEMAFADSSSKHSQAAFLMGARWTRNPLELFEAVEDDQIATADEEAPARSPAGEA